MHSLDSLFFLHFSFFSVGGRVWFYCCFTYCSIKKTFRRQDVPLFPNLHLHIVYCSTNNICAFRVKDHSYLRAYVTFLPIYLPGLYQSTPADVSVYLAWGSSQLMWNGRSFWRASYVFSGINAALWPSLKPKTLETTGVINSTPPSTHLFIFYSLCLSLKVVRDGCLLICSVT